MSQTYGATPGGTPATAGGAADAAPLLGKGLKGKKIGGAERMWMDMFIAVVSLVVIVGTFFVTIELMNYEYKRTTFEVHTGCLPTVTEQRLKLAGFDVANDPIQSVYVVPSGAAPVKMAKAKDGRQGVFTVQTWMPTSEWSFAVAGSHDRETVATLFFESGNATTSPLALPRNHRCATETEPTGLFTRQLTDDQVSNGGFVSLVFGSCDWSCDSAYPPETAAGGKDEMSGDDVSFFDADADPTNRAAASTTSTGGERFSSPPVYPGAPDTTAVLDLDVDTNGFMVLPDGIPSGVVLMEGGSEQPFTTQRAAPGGHSMGTV